MDDYAAYWLEEVLGRTRRRLRPMPAEQQLQQPDRVESSAQQAPVICTSGLKPWPGAAVTLHGIVAG